MRARSESGRFLRFVIVGLSNTALSGAVFWLCLHSTGPLSGAFAAQGIAYSCGLVWSYTWNRTWAFGSSDRLLASAVRFLALQLALLTSSALSLGVIVDTLGAPAAPAWLCVMAAITLLNYSGQRSVVFVRRADA